MNTNLTMPKNINKTKVNQFKAYYEITKLNDNKLKNINQQSLINTLATIFELNLSNSPLKKEIALIPYGNDLQVQIQEDGFLTLLQRSNLVTDFQREVITDKHFYNKDTERWELDPASIFETNKRVIGYFGSITIKNINDKPIKFIKGMTVQECEEWRRKYSKAQANSPWVTAFNQMSLKTVIKAIIRDILKTPNIKLQNEEIIDRALQMDQAMTVDAETITYPDNPNSNSVSKITNTVPIINKSVLENRAFVPKNDDNVPNYEELANEESNYNDQLRVIEELNLEE